MALPLFHFFKVLFHRISRMNRRHSCLSDYSRIFADIWPLTNGWRPKYSLIVFVTQISQMTQIFLRGSFLSHNIDDLWRNSFSFYVEVKNGEMRRKWKRKSKKNLKVGLLQRNILYIRELFVILHSVWNRYQLTN